jgi:hypothetical protein
MKLLRLGMSRSLASHQCSSHLAGPLDLPLVLASEGIHLLDEFGACAISHRRRLMMRAADAGTRGPSLKGH